MQDRQCSQWKSCTHAYLNRDLEINCFVSHEFNNGLAHCILKVKKSLFKIGAVQNCKKQVGYVHVCVRYIYLYAANVYTITCHITLELLNQVLDLGLQVLSYLFSMRIHNNNMVASDEECTLC